jgi:hypothetical protein
MATVDDAPLDRWDRRQWASDSMTIAPAATAPRWSLWQWVGKKPRVTCELGSGDGGLSGFGHNPSGQHWAEQLRVATPSYMPTRP